MTSKARYDIVIFDFDGTIADTKEGIMNGARYALNKCGVSESDYGDLKRFVGPTLWYSFETFYAFDSTMQGKAVQCYREYYKAHGIHEVSLYEGIVDLLIKLKESNILIGIASAKHQKSVETALNNLGIAKYFSAVSGSLMNGDRSDKAELIASVLDDLQCSDNNRVIFIGDSRTDAIGAQECRVDFIAALYDRDEKEFEGIILDKKANELKDLGKYLFD